MADDEAAAAAKLAELGQRYPGVVAVPSQAPESKSPEEWEREAIQQRIDCDHPGLPVKPPPDNLLPFKPPTEPKVD